MLTVDDLTARILRSAGPLPAITVQLLDGMGCFLAHDAVARVAQGTDAVFLEAGALTSTRHLPRLVAAGVSEITVVPRPRVVVLTSDTGAVSEANHVVLSAACSDAGAQVYRVTGSDGRATREVIDDQLVRADLVLVAADDVGAATAELAELGEVAVSELAVSPSMSVGYGLIGDDATPALVLPGRPLLAYLAFEVLVRPLIRTLAGAPEPFRATHRARATRAWQPPPAVQELRLGRLTVVDGVYAFVPTLDGEAAHMLALSNAVARVPAQTSPVAVGDVVLVIPFDGELT